MGVTDQGNASITSNHTNIKEWIHHILQIIVMFLCWSLSVVQVKCTVHLNLLMACARGSSYNLQSTARTDYHKHSQAGGCKSRQGRRGEGVAIQKEI